MQLLQRQFRSVGKYMMQSLLFSTRKLSRNSIHAVNRKEVTNNSRPFSGFTLGQRGVSVKFYFYNFWISILHFIVTGKIHRKGSNILDVQLSTDLLVTIVENYFRFGNMNLSNLGYHFNPKTLTASTFLTDSKLFSVKLIESSELEHQLLGEKLAVFMMFLALT